MKATRTTRTVSALTLLAVLGGSWVVAAVKDPAPDAKLAAAPTTQRARGDIMADLNAAGAELGQVLSSPEDALVEAKRKELAPKAIPVIKKLMAAFDELAAIDPNAKQQRPMFLAQFHPILVLLGDAEIETKLKGQAKQADAEGVGAKVSLVIADYWRANKDAAAQAKALDELSTLAKANAKDDSIGQAAMLMIRFGAASDASKDRIVKILKEDLKSPMAEQITQQMDAEKKIKAIENKPLTLEGTTVDGKAFSTKDWKGKVILVDFWATWCGPCIHELPNVEKAYATYHEKGLEILGVSCDRSADALTKFVEERKATMPWPHLFDKNAAGWHPLATQYGVQGIPTMFLIDRKGIVRTVEARGKLDELIPALLAEKAE